jgi:hypothetical protein
MEFSRDIRRRKEILIRKNTSRPTSRPTKNTPYGNTRFPGARKQLSFNSQSDNDNAPEVRAETPNSGATNFYGRQNSSCGSEGREGGSTNFSGQQRYR